MIRHIIHGVLAASLIATVASCKKNADESGSSNAASSAKAADNKPAQPESTGIPECDALVKADDKFVKCDKLPAEQKQAYANSFEKDRQSYMEAKDKAATAEQCKKAMSDLVEGAKARNCPMD
jgi:hypothetical protein